MDKDVYKRQVHNDDQEVLVELLGAVKPKNNLYAIVQTKHSIPVRVPAVPR